MDSFRAQMAQHNFETSTRNFGPWTVDASSMQVPPFLSPYLQYQQQQGSLIGGNSSSHGLVQANTIANPFSQTWQYGGNFLNTAGGYPPRETTYQLIGEEPASP